MVMLLTWLMIMGIMWPNDHHDGDCAGGNDY